MTNPTAFGVLVTPVDHILIDALSRTEDFDRRFTSDEELALQVLAIATRENHAALPLGDDLCQILNDSCLPDEHEDVELIAQIVRRGFASLQGQSLVEEATLSSPLALRGPAIVMSSSEEDVFVAFRRYAFAESQIAERLQSALNPSTAFAPVAVGEIQELLATEKLDDEAKQAITRALTTNFSVITGGPGSGKTSTIAAMLRILSRIAASRGDRTYRVGLCAPTAKAAVRMTEALESAMATDGAEGRVRLGDLLGEHLEVDKRSGSVHQLLGIRPDKTKSLKILGHDLIVVDEVSMLEVTLLAKLIEQAPNAHIVLVGDQNQLASVNVGAALRDIVDGCAASALAPLVTTLLGNYRSTKKIRLVADAINSGEPVAVRNAIDASDGVVTFAETPSSVHSLVDAWAATMEERARFGRTEDALRSIGELAVLCATKRGKGSVQFWRERVERALGPRADSEGQFRIGAPVLVTENERLGADRKSVV
jgi:exodeoxyribonuclease V alpha subunit